MSSPQVVAGKVRLEVLLPPHYAGLVGVYPLHLFRPERIVTKTQPVSIVVDGEHYDCDGSIYRIEHTHALSLGSFIAMEVLNLSDEPVPLDLEFHGPSMGQGGSGPYVGGVCLAASLAAVREPPRTA